MIKFENFSFSYPKSGMIIKSLDLEIYNNEITAILGENGAGKTTMLKCAMGINKRTSDEHGNIYFDGELLSKNPETAAFISCEGSFLGNLSPLEYGEFLSVFYSGFDTKLYTRLLEFFALPEIESGKFSKGQSAKLELASGLCRGAKHILMDEPFDGKDFLTRKDFMKIMAGGLADGRCVLIATHDLINIERLADRIVVIADGSVAADARVQEIQENGINAAEFYKRAVGYNSEKYKKVLLEE